MDSCGARVELGVVMAHRPFVDAEFPAHLAQQQPDGEGQQHRVECRGSNEEVEREVLNEIHATHTGRPITNTIEESSLTGQMCTLATCFASVCVHGCMHAWSRNRIRVFSNHGVNEKDDGHDALRHVAHDCEQQVMHDQRCSNTDTHKEAWESGTPTHSSDLAHTHAHTCTHDCICPCIHPFPTHTVVSSCVVRQQVGNQ